MEIVSTRAIAKWAGVSGRTVSVWRRDHPDCPIALKGRKLTVTDFALRKWLHEKGYAPPEARMEAPPPVAPEVSTPKNGAPGDPSDEILDPATLANLPEPSGDVEGDLAIARRVAHRLQSIVAAWKVDTLDDPARARLFGQYIEILSKVMTRIAGLETSFIKIQQQRGELLGIDKVGDLLTEFVAAALAELDELLRRVVDTVKAEELEEYGTSRIDSENLTDRIDGLARGFRARVAGRLENPVAEKGAA